MIPHQPGGRIYSPDSFDYVFIFLSLIVEFPNKDNALPQKRGP
jgi:hypothetical protein